MDKVLLRRNELQNEIVPNSISLAKNINNLVTWFDTANGDLNNNIDSDKLTVCILTFINLRKTFETHHSTLRMMVFSESLSGPCPCLAHVRVGPMSVTGTCPCLVHVRVWSMSVSILL